MGARQQHLSALEERQRNEELLALRKPVPGLLVGCRVGPVVLDVAEYFEFLAVGRQLI